MRRGAGSDVPRSVLIAKSTPRTERRPTLEALCAERGGRARAWLALPVRARARRQRRCSTAARAPGTLLGVDAVRDGRLIGARSDESGLLDADIGGAGGRLVLGVVGGQGSLLGRGNQQLSARGAARADRDRIMVVRRRASCSRSHPPALRVDTRRRPARPAAVAATFASHVARAAR